MPSKDPEVIKRNWKKYYENNKEKRRLYNKQYREKNRIELREKRKDWLKTSKGKKYEKIRHWKQRGLKEYGYTYDDVYEYYVDTTHCEVCNISLSLKTKCMDHCHTTGCFRWILCISCNCHDNWMKYF